jgi:catechol 2,3-dioxygenase-like lactoylglutathione lyase family enzyme
MDDGWPLRHPAAEGNSLMPLTHARPIAFVMTKDRKAAEGFYGETLGLARGPDEPHCAVFDLAGTELRITEAADHAPGPHPVLGWDVPDLEATVDALAARGVRCTVYEGMGMDERGIWTSPDGRSKIAFFPDPDGNVLVLSQG